MKIAARFEELGFTVLPVATPVSIALVAHNGCYLVGRRGPDAPLAGYFEFPGGKCHPGESPAACVVRECLEETGLAIEVIRLRREVFHTYSYGSVHLHFFDCRLLTRDRVGSDHTQPFREFDWVPMTQLAEINFPEPNRQLVDELLAEAT